MSVASLPDVSSRFPTVLVAAVVPRGSGLEYTMNRADVKTSNQLLAVDRRTRTCSNTRSIIVRRLLHLATLLNHAPGFDRIGDPADHACGRVAIITASYCRVNHLWAEITAGHIGGRLIISPGPEGSVYRWLSSGRSSINLELADQ
jgi:hypothetical protein